MKNKVISFAFVLIFLFIICISAYAEPEGETSAETTTEVVQTPAETSATEQTPTEAASQNSGAAKSSDSALKSLVVVGKTESGESVSVVLSPEFKAATRTYTLTVPFEVVRLEIAAEANSAKAKTEVPAGYLTLDVGNNRSFVYVTAENGAKRTYQINVTRSEQVVTQPVTEAQTVVETTTLSETTEPATVVEPIDLPASSGNVSVNSYTKLGIVFACAAAVFIIISIVLFVKNKNNPDGE